MCSQRHPFPLPAWLWIASLALIVMAVSAHAQGTGQSIATETAPDAVLNFTTDPDQTTFEQCLESRFPPELWSSRIARSTCNENNRIPTRDDIGSDSAGSGGGGWSGGGSSWGGG